MKTLNHFDDQKLKFEDGMYVLTLTEIKKRFDTIMEDAEIERRAYKNSCHVYDYILNHCHSQNVSLFTKILNETEEGRSFILKVLSAQMEADLMSGYNDIGKQVLVDVSNGKNIDRNLIRQNLLCVDAQILIENSASYFGFSIVSPVKVTLL